jgi:uncharacterized Fe-S cluster-containing radical SAM superfamily protein
MQTTLDGMNELGVFLTLQKDYGNEKSRYKQTFAIQQCGGDPGEIALRFAGCCMKCGACFASGYSWIDRFQKNYRVIMVRKPEDVIRDFTRIQYPDGYRSYNWFRILGGEPLLNERYIKFLFDSIIKISKIDSAKFNNGVIIQTNGIFVGQGNVELLRRKLEELYNSNPHVKVCIEVSIKGTNVEEFSLITRSAKRPNKELLRFKRLFGWDLGAYLPEDLFRFNISAYYKLKDIADDLPNFCPSIIAGFGVNESYLLKGGKSTERITIIFNDGKPIYHPKHWSNDFKELYEDFTKEAVKTFGPLFSKMLMYGIKDIFEYPWVPRALRQGRQVYDERWYDAKFADERGGRNLTLEEAFSDILDKFFLVDNKTYYSLLINWKKNPSE